MANLSSFRQIYDSPPVQSFQAQGDRGISSTSSFYPVNPPPERQTPRHIMQDTGIGPGALAFARNYLQNIQTIPGADFLATHTALPVFMQQDQTESREFNAQNIFAKVVMYCISFVQHCDALPAGSVSLRDCQMRHSIKPDGRLSRLESTRAILEYEGKRALDAHAGDIIGLASANGGGGTELIRQANETGARSIVFKVNGPCILVK